MCGRATSRAGSCRRASEERRPSKLLVRHRGLPARPHWQRLQMRLIAVRARSSDAGAASSALKSRAAPLVDKLAGVCRPSCRRTARARSNIVPCLAGATTPVNARKPSSGHGHRSDRAAWSAFVVRWRWLDASTEVTTRPRRYQSCARATACGAANRPYAVDFASCAMERSEAASRLQPAHHCVH